MKEFLILASSLLMPAIVSYLKGSTWPVGAKYAVALVVSLLLGALTAYADGNLDFTNVAGAAGVIGMLATGFYQVYFKNTELNQNLERSGPFSS